ncbi:MAG: matrixin family metalloprotease, partial [Gammaproteobacteria bacterium]
MLHSVSPVTLAGTYLFTSETGVDNVITHPTSYTGTESDVVVRICIDPASANAGVMEIPVQNNINIFNKLQSTVGNIKSGANNSIASNQIDFESVALHEIGHCIGMGHVNLGSESGLADSLWNYTKSTVGVDNSFNLAVGADGVIGSSDDVRGDDVNLHWFQKSNNDPFTIASVIDKTTYSIDTTDLPTGDKYVANADRILSTSLGLPKTEAVMQQGTYFDEAQRTLGHDDVATISYAASGLDEQAGT